jgi:SAM-dependent methyltransferase
VVRRPLAGWLEAEAGELDPTLVQRGRVLDVGCGERPYEAFFASHVADYVGLDFVETPFADLIGPAEALPVEDASFDVVLCTQVLEHCEDPARVVSELRRVTRPGGRVLASTHGVQPYHPSPSDHWRWTHTGLELLFRANADWRTLRVSAGSGTAACLGMLGGRYIDLAAKRLRVRPLAAPFLFVLNTSTLGLERAAPRLRSMQAGSLVANYHVRAEC